MSDELEELRKQKLAAMQQQAVQEQAQIMQQVQQLENLVKPRMTKPALERFGNIRAAHPDKAVQSLVVLAQLIQSNKLTIIDDTTLKEILLKLTQEKKEFKLTKR
ncbi:MAG: DNA-binding protein [Candidatus Woesearchaeota archaeon]|jgi:DNA-binding TFAR19-related protein (PDSD5 family)|nr:DNA-binding protein [Candidatus Woesearchaeota archaeon]|tara:strand:+ start:1212 stop:1526 length:315 start_codon:yes stop_codon:yes gene_type:complete